MTLEISLANRRQPALLGVETGNQGRWLGRPPLGETGDFPPNYVPFKKDRCSLEKLMTDPSFAIIAGAWVRRDLLDINRYP
jgi:hypothetical protein